MKTLIATQAVSFGPRGSLHIDAATDGNGPVWADNFSQEFIVAFCADGSTDDLVCKISFKNPLYVQSQDACTDADAPGARDLIRAVAIAAIERNDEIMLRCAISYRERLLSAGRADSDESQAATKFVKDQCRKMYLDFDVKTLATYGSVRYNDVLRTIAAVEYTPVPFIE